jgi:phosphatidylglycerophosphatase A
VLAVAPVAPLAYAAGFVLFRVADIVKPFPANWADREVHGGLGIMLDDIFAALYAGLALFLLVRFGLV